MTKPISPSEALKAKGEHIPSVVFEVFNDHIARNLRPQNRVSIVNQNAIIEDLVAIHNLCKLDIINNKWLDVEDSYRNAGWKVAYDKPAYNETYEPYFRFEGK